VETRLPHSPLSQVIIAGGDEEIGPADLIDWVQPVLSGMASGSWTTCEIAYAGRGCLTARIRNSTHVPRLALCSTIPRRDARALWRLLPGAPAAVILLDDHAAQVMTLLDGLARWLNVFEAAEPALAPIVGLLSDHAARPAQRRRAPLPGPF
jgi:hypothetical protein